MVEPIDQVLMSLRQLIRATELHSKQLLKKTRADHPAAADIARHS